MSFYFNSDLVKMCNLCGIIDVNIITSLWQMQDLDTCVCKQLAPVLLCNSIKGTITPWMLLYDVCYVYGGLAALGSLSKEVHNVAFQVETIKQTLVSHCYVLFNPVTQCCTIYAYVTFIVSKNKIKKYTTCFNHVLKE